MFTNTSYVATLLKCRILVLQHPFPVTTTSNTLQLGDGSVSWKSVDGKVSRCRHVTNMYCHKLSSCSILSGGLRHAPMHTVIMHNLSEARWTAVESLHAACSLAGHSARCHGGTKGNEEAGIPDFQTSTRQRPYARCRT